MNHEISNTEERYLGYVYVDSGQLVLCDPCNITDYTHFTYNEVCRMTLAGGGQLNFDGDRPGAGVAIPTELGDETYHIYASYRGGVIVGLRIEI